MNISVSVIIVNYNTKELLKNCLDSIIRNTSDINYEIIVSDNGSKDGSCEMIKSQYPSVILIENNQNLGFGKANNVGLKIAKGEFIFYLNSDTVILNNAIKIFYDSWKKYDQNNDLGALGCNLLNSKMQVIHSKGNLEKYLYNIKDLIKMSLTNIILTFCTIFKIFPSIFYKTKAKENFYLGEVGFITGADLFLKNDNYAAFDENFTLYYEDTDLQKTLFNAGKKRILIDGPLIQHLCGGSVGERMTIYRKATFSRIQFELSRVRYLNKHYPDTVLLFFIKSLITIIWCNPFLLPKTRHHIPELWNI